MMEEFDYIKRTWNLEEAIMLQHWVTKFGISHSLTKASELKDKKNHGAISLHHHPFKFFKNFMIIHSHNLGDNKWVTILNNRNFCLKLLLMFSKHK